MNTLTLFEAYVKTRNIRDYFAGREIAPKFAARHERLFRQQLVFSDAIRARLTPPRKRVRLVTIADTFASVARTHEDNSGTGYFVTPSSRRRLLGVCEQHMVRHGEKFGVIAFSREGMGRQQCPKSASPS